MLNKMIQKVLIVIAFLVTCNIQTELANSQTQPTLTIQSEEDGINALAFSHDSSMILIGWRTGTVWDVKTGKKLHQVEPLYGAYSGAFSPNDQMIVTGAGPLTISIFDLKTDQLVSEFSGPRNLGLRTYTAVAFTLDGKSIIAGQEGGDIHLWDIETGERKYFNHFLDLYLGCKYSPMENVCLLCIKSSLFQMEKLCMNL